MMTLKFLLETILHITQVTDLLLSGLHNKNKTIKTGLLYSTIKQNCIDV